MYNFLKKAGKRILPKSIASKYDSFFRKLITLKYRGSTFQCNICGTKLNNFVKLKANDLLCPACGSRSRTRRLQTLVSDLDLKGNLLHFSPPKSLYKSFKSDSTFKYFSSDFVGEFDADYNFDITNISIEDNFFEAIICYHVLEHIIDDILAMKELYRVLKPNGLCLIQTPFKTGTIYEDYSLTSENDRKKAFGQKDHVRLYSVEGLKKRLESIGFVVEVTNFKKKENVFNGLITETILFVRKK